MSNPKSDKSKADAKKVEAREVIRSVITGDEATVGGKTFIIPQLDDLPRSVRRAIRQVQVKYAMPSEGDVSGGRYDVYGVSYEVGLIVARHHGAQIDPDDDSISAHAADQQDAVLTALGLRVISSSAQAGEGEAGDAPNEGAASA